MITLRSRVFLLTTAEKRLVAEIGLVIVHIAYSIENFFINRQWYITLGPGVETPDIIHDLMPDNCNLGIIPRSHDFNLSRIDKKIRPKCFISPRGGGIDSQFLVFTLQVSFLSSFKFLPFAFVPISDNGGVLKVKVPMSIQSHDTNAIGAPFVGFRRILESVK